MPRKERLKHEKEEHSLKNEYEDVDVKVKHEVTPNPSQFSPHPSSARRGRARQPVPTASAGPSNEVEIKHDPEVPPKPEPNPLARQRSESSYSPTIKNEFANDFNFFRNENRKKAIAAEIPEVGEYYADRISEAGADRDKVRQLRAEEADEFTKLGQERQLLHWEYLGGMNALRAAGHDISAFERPARSFGLGAGPRRPGEELPPQPPALPTHWFHLGDRLSYGYIGEGDDVQTVVWDRVGNRAQYWPGRRVLRFRDPGGRRHESSLAHPRRSSQARDRVAQQFSQMEGRVRRVDQLRERGLI
ncbi:hypothetical protein T439DRAFT_380937 [Meredithblackwellia eburnea MCA 4105]